MSDMGHHQAEDRWDRSWATKEEAVAGGSAWPGGNGGDP